MQPENAAGQPYGPPVRMLAGRYRISDRLLGRGGLADVWAATDEACSRPVAVKMFRPGSEAGESRRFAEEVRTLSGLSHPHLIALYDAGEAEGRAYLVMREVPGRTLGAELRSCGSLPAETVRTIGAQVASALAYIHGRGIVHRDVKPANILLDTFGSAVLADFGIARMVNGTRLTTTGLTVGTAAYLSPEQVRGREVGPPADVYALGLVLLEALTGRREYDGDPVEAAVARLYRAPEVPESLPHGLTGLLRAMTAEEPLQRPPASHVSEVLGRAVAAVPSSIRAVAGAPRVDITSPLPVPRRDRRRMRALWLAPAVLAIGATAAVMSLQASGGPDGAGVPGHARAVPAPSTSAAGSNGAAAQTGQPSAGTPQTPAPMSPDLLSAASVATRAAPPPAAHPPAPGNGKGHAGGHGRGRHGGGRKHH